MLAMHESTTVPTQGANANVYHVFGFFPLKHGSHLSLSDSSAALQTPPPLYTGDPHS